MSIRPPFRADQVGSLLRSATLKEARDKRAKGAISAAELTAVEDVEIKKIIAKQEAIGLEGITDGEFRRSWWHYDFLWNLDGIEKVSVDQGIQFAGVQTKAEAADPAGNRVGDGVTPVALSHHRTCGSASGGSLNTLESAHRIEQRHQT